MTRTGHVGRLLKSEPRPFLEVNPVDAARYRVRDGDLVRVTSRRGSADLPARVSETVRAGAVFAPFHWGTLHGHRTGTNRAAGEAVDPVCRQPELKFAAVRLEVLAPARPRAGTGPDAARARR